jgi:hypothetical protein
MEAIKKKMQAMKVEKDNLMDRCDTMELVSHTYNTDATIHNALLKDPYQNIVLPIFHPFLYFKKRQNTVSI